jgi:hypothetical protein
MPIGVTALARALEHWTEMDLDRCRLPHPLLGKITVREMLFFTLYHYEHHWAIVAERLGTSGIVKGVHLSPHSGRDLHH